MGVVLDNVFAFTMTMRMKIKSVSIHRQQLLHEVVTQLFLRQSFQIVLQDMAVLNGNSLIEIPGITSVKLQQNARKAELNSYTSLSKHRILHSDLSERLRHILQALVQKMRNFFTSRT